jgi:hypothetical protein
MRKVAFDVETHLIQPGMVFPKLVCVSISDGQTHDVFLAGLGLKEMLRHLQDPNTQIIGHNVSFDLGVIAAEAIDQGYDPHWVMELIFNAYAADRIVDTMIRAMLVAIAQGKFQEIEGQRRGKQFGLDVLSDAWLGTTITKKSYSKKQQAQGANLKFLETSLRRSRKYSAGPVAQRRLRLRSRRRGSNVEDQRSDLSVGDLGRPSGRRDPG